MRRCGDLRSFSFHSFETVVELARAVRDRETERAGAWSCGGKTRRPTAAGGDMIRSPVSFNPSASPRRRSGQGRERRATPRSHATEAMFFIRRPRI